MRPIKLLLSNCESSVSIYLRTTHDLCLEGWQVHSYFTLGGRVLQIPRAQSEDAGQYTCVAINEAGEDSIQYDVRVLCELT